MSNANNLPEGQSPAHYARELMNQAKKEKKFLFNKVVKRWYTPEEYFELQERITYDGSNDWKNIKLMNVSEGLKAADTQIQDIMDRRRLLEIKAIEYYKNQPKT